MPWAPDYITTAQLKSFLRIADTVDDVQLAVAITAASRAIDRACSRQFGKTDTTEQRTYTARWDRHRVRRAWVVDIDDLATTGALAVSIGGTAVTDYSLEPVNAVKKGKVWTALVLGRNAEVRPTHSEDFTVDITGTWGWTAFPTAVVMATYLQASRFIARRDSPYGIAGSPADSSELRLLAQVDPDVRVSLGEYVRRWGAAGSPVPHQGQHLHPAGWGLW